MTPTPDYFSTILTVALTSAGVAALISSGVTAFNEWRRRVSEERRFAVDAALQIVKMRNEQKTKLLALAQRGGKSFNIHYSDPLISLIWYRKQLERLLKGQFSKVEKEFSKQLEEFEAKWREK